MDEEKKVTASETEERDVKVIKASKDGADKRSLKRRIVKITATAVICIVICLVLAFLCRDVLIENGVRHIGTLVTGTGVEIASFDSSLKGTVDLRNIKVANPKGYHNPYAFEVDRIRIKIDTGTLTSDEPVVEYVEITGVRIDMEVKGDGRSNLIDIQRNVEKFAGGDDKAADDKKTEKEESETKKKSGSEVSPLIKQITMTAMGISLSSATFKTSVPVPLAPIYLENIGGKGNPLGETLLQIFNTLMNSVNSVAGTVMSGVELVGNAGKAVGDGVSSGVKQVGNAGRAVGTSVTDGAKKLGEGVKSIRDGVGGLFKNK